MLLSLSVSNYILIPQLTLEFHKGFSCITGETGAGKSILIGALGLALGQRADTGVLREKDKKCIIEAYFRLSDYGLEPFFAENELDFESVSIFRREITPQGKSRAFINDTPVNLTVLKEIGDRLIDIHSQHQTLELNQAYFQLGMIDAYSHNRETLEKYTQLYKKYLSISRELEKLSEQEKQANAEREYLQFQFDEIENARLQEGEQQKAEEELQLLTHAEEIKQKTYAALQLLNESETSIINNLSEAKTLIEAASRYGNSLYGLAERLESSRIEVNDITNDLERLTANIMLDPEQIEKLNERLDLIYHLEQKHRVKSIAEILELGNLFSEKLLNISSLGGKMGELKENLSITSDELLQLSVVLSNNRKKAIPNMEKDMMQVLSALAMPSAQFKAQWVPLDSFSPTGKDKVTFLFAANKGSELRELSKVASGGELSRLMLAIKSLVLNRSLLPTVIFDEIDNGVSGEIAGKVGAILKNMSAHMQVIAITHLPQIAGKADEHILAYKQQRDNASVSNLKKLSKEERVLEIARMLSDEVITESAKSTARELLNYKN